ncbi:unnamed protein product [Paramecium pentaurelia]|uniref:Transmembrane protein n=1 Tax=Paramecium pentaurelia TaxID=43138 RepID=A0A8S1VCC8_9CILI|nr:unnamed protein product [Paramecium pentaurelia]
MDHSQNMSYRKNCKKIHIHKSFQFLFYYHLKKVQIEQILKNFFEKLLILQQQFFKIQMDILRHHFYKFCSVLVISFLIFLFSLVVLIYQIFHHSKQHQQKQLIMKNLKQENQIIYRKQLRLSKLKLEWTSKLNHQNYQGLFIILHQYCKFLFQHYYISIHLHLTLEFDLIS